MTWWKSGVTSPDWRSACKTASLALRRLLNYSSMSFLGRHSRYFWAELHPTDWSWYAYEVVVIYHCRLATNTNCCWHQCDWLYVSHNCVFTTKRGTNILLKWIGQSWPQGHVAASLADCDNSPHGSGWILVSRCFIKDLIKDLNWEHSWIQILFAGDHSCIQSAAWNTVQPKQWAWPATKRLPGHHAAPAAVHWQREACWQPGRQALREVWSHTGVGDSGATWHSALVRYKGNCCIWFFALIWSTFQLCLGSAVLSRTQHGSVNQSCTVKALFTLRSRKITFQVMVQRCIQAVSWKCKGDGQKTRWAWLICWMLCAAELLRERGAKDLWALQDVSSSSFWWRGPWLLQGEVKTHVGTFRVSAWNSGT